MRTIPTLVLLLLCASCSEPWREPGGSDWTQVEVGWRRVACGLHEGGEVECWGREEEFLEGTYVQIAGGDLFYGLDDQGQVLSWSAEGGTRLLEADTPMVRIWGFEDGVCGIDAQGSVYCELMHRDRLTRLSPSGPFTGLAAWNLQLLEARWCGLRVDHTLECFDVEIDGIEGEYSQIAGSTWYGFCALDLEGSAHCWQNGQLARGADGPFQQVDMYEDVDERPLACGLLESGEVECWTVGEWEPDYEPLPDERYQQISVGFAALCGLREDGKLECSRHDCGY